MAQTASEINGTNAYEQTEGWLAKVNTFFAVNDPYRHPITASKSGDVLGRLQNADDFLRESLFTFRTAGNAHGTTFTLEGLASLLVVNGQWEKATSLFAYATKQYEDLHGARPPVEQDSVDKDLAMIHSHMDEVTFDKFWTEGISLKLEEAIELATEELK